MGQKYKKIDRDMSEFLKSDDKFHFYLNTILQNSRDILYLYDLKNERCEFISESVEMVTGYTANEVMDQGVDLLIENLHPDDRPAFMEIYLGLINNTISDSSVHLKHRTRHKNGQYLWLSHEINTIRDENGVTQIFTGTVRDVTQQEKQEQALKMSEQKYRDTFNANSDGITIHDPETGRMLEFNQRFLDVYGYTYDEALLLTVEDLSSGQPPYIQETAMQYIQKAVQDGMHRFLWHARKKNGELFWTEGILTSAEICGEKRVLAAVRDITALKEAQDKLKASQERFKLLSEVASENEKKYRELYNDAHIALFRTSLDGVLMQCNKACHSFFSHDPDEEENYLNKIRVTDYYVDAARRQAFLEELKQYGHVTGFEAQLKRHDGTTFWASFSARIFPESGYIEGAMYDITIAKTLSKAERKVLKILLQGKSNKEIAKELQRSVRTIEDHRSHIMQKLGVDNPFDLAKKAMECNFY
ncbi:MAG: PAS domain S-box protein [Planctomycetota bacterium]|jgi:PAS domain S-box-containing protein